MTYFTTAIYIIIDSLLENKYENALIPLYMLFLLPTIVFSVYVFSRLENIQLNKCLKAVFFSVLSTLTLSVSYAIGNYLDTQELDINSIFRISILSLIIHVLLYIQLPWSRNSAK